MPRAWSQKKERKYEHIEQSAEEYGRSTERAKEIAARTVNKERAQEGRARRASETSTHDVSPEHRGGKRSGNRMGPGGMTKDQLYHEAQQCGLKGRSTMSKRELQRALGKP